MPYAPGASSKAHIKDLAPDVRSAHIGPNIRARAKELLHGRGLPEYPADMRETFQRLMDEHGIDASKYLS